jgi:hypothetical protein
MLQAVPAPLYTGSEARAKESRPPVSSTGSDRQPASRPFSVPANGVLHWLVQMETP